MEDEKKENVDTQTTTDNAQKEQKTENKNEGEKTKKQVAQKGDDGSIVFKNQDELDGFIRSFSLFCFFSTFGIHSSNKSI